MGWGYFGLFLPIFVGFFMLVFLLTFSHGILQKCFWYYSAGHYTQKIQSMVFSTGGHFGLLLGSFWCMFQYFLRNVWFFLMKFYTDILGIYSLTVNTLFLFFHALFSWNPFWCMFHYFVRIIRYFLMKSCIDVFSTTLWWSLQ